MIIYLVLMLPPGSSDLPESTTGSRIAFLFGLASDGVYICHLCYQRCGELLPRLSTLALKKVWFISVALALESPPPDVIRHPALRSSDFPHLKPFGINRRDHLCYSFLKQNYSSMILKKSKPESCKNYGEII